jgi:hypothetical protein
MQGYHGQGSCLRQAAKPSPINGTQSQFSCKKTIPLDMWDVKGNCAKGRSKEALQINRELDNIKAQIIKHYQHLSDREAFVTAEMVRRSALGTLCLQRTHIRVSAANMKLCLAFTIKQWAIIAYHLLV